MIWYGARTAPGNLAVIAALAAATDTSPLLSAAFANTASTPSALATTGASTLVSAPSGGSPELCFTRRAASSFATSSDACQACSSAAAAIVTADCGETTPRFVCRGPVAATWRPQSGIGTFGIRRIRHVAPSRRRDAAAERGAILAARPRRSPHPAKLLDIGREARARQPSPLEIRNRDVVMPNQPPSSRAGLVPTGHLDAAQDDRLQDGDVNTIRGRIKEAVRKRPVEEVRTAGIAAKLSITSREDALVHAREVRRYCDQLHPNRPLSQPMAGLLYTAGGRTRRVGRRIRRIRRSRQPELVATRRAHAEESGVCAQIARRRAGGSGRCAELFRPGSGGRVAPVCQESSGPLIVRREPTERDGRRRELKAAQSYCRLCVLYSTVA